MKNYLPRVTRPSSPQAAAKLDRSLFNAVQALDYDEAQQCIDFGADPNARIPGEGSVIHGLAKSPLFGISWYRTSNKYFAKGGKILELLKSYGVDVNVQDDNGNSILHVDVLKGPLSRFHPDSGSGCRQ